MLSTSSIQHAILLMLLSTPVHALPTTTTPPQSRDSNPSNTSWSTEAILGLTAIVVAVICCAVSLAWPTIYRRSRWRRASRSLLPHAAYLPARLNPFDEQPWRQRPVAAHHHYYVRVDRAEIRMGPGES
ncbi:hypothetical protein C7974DRAFT_440850 [Boeremia exigua]|uniref:uncharacterized protein n=1 Tax=Boeremia exigua TaxID=749465 RepID=UPI001E8ECE6A|nr:uncharacterized protein C7974DRAFT_440850 [Boeremia exigua]KAH6618549.1 hypothetical protein C7974DRAFT_440850 [Boeremia exigua]